MARVAALAIDALEPWLLDEERRAGRVPHLDALARRAARVPLEAVGSYRSDLAWVRFLAGQPDEVTGFHGLLSFDPASYEIHDRGTWVGAPFYAGPDRRTISFDLPGSVVDPEVTGIQVTGWGCHSPQWWRASAPAGLLTELDAAVGTNPAYGNEHDLMWHEPARIEALTAACEVGTRRRADGVRWLLEREPDWNLLLTAVSEVHTMAHHLWFGVDGTHPLHDSPTAALAGDAMRRTVGAADAALGDLLAAVPSDAYVVVFALHGMQAADDAAAMVLLPELVHRRHRGRALLQDQSEARWRAEGCPPVVLSTGEPWHGYVRERFHDGPDLLRRAGRHAPGWAYAAARRLAGRDAVHDPAELVGGTPAEVDLATAGAWRHDDVDWQVSSWYRRHWPSMPWFSVPTFDDAVVRVNLIGRESSGLVEREDYDRACDDVEALARELVDARTGAPAVAEVTRLRPGDPMDPDGPTGDVLIRWAGAPDALCHPDLGFVGPIPHARTGSHSTNGFALVAGPGIEPGDHPSRPAADLAPTIRALLGGAGPATAGRPLLEPSRR